MAESTTYFQVISCVKHSHNVQVSMVSTMMHLGFRCSGIYSTGWRLVTNLSGLPSNPILKDQAVGLLDPWKEGC